MQVHAFIVLKDMEWIQVLAQFALIQSVNFAHKIRIHADLAKTLMVWTQ